MAVMEEANEAKGQMFSLVSYTVEPCRELISPSFASLCFVPPGR